MIKSRLRLAILVVLIVITLASVATLLTLRQRSAERHQILEELQAVSITGIRPGTPSWLNDWFNQEQGYKLFGEDLTMVSFTKVPSDALLERMTVFDTIETIAFPEGKELNNDNLKYMAQLPNLKQIWFEGPDFPKGGFAPLKDLAKLETLIFSGLDPENDLGQLFILPNLKYIEFGNSKHSNKAVDELRKALPGCKINLTQRPNRLRRAATSSKSQVRTPLSPDEQRQFLNKRVQSGLYGTSGPSGSFRSYASLLKAAQNLMLSTHDRSISETSLTPVIVNGYVPTVRELLDVIARQTKSHWEYDAKYDRWVFSKPASDIPFRISAAKGWKQEDRGVFVFYKPPTGQVGMEVYVLGAYSFEKEVEAQKERVRRGQAIRWAKTFVTEVSDQDFSVIQVGGNEALYFESSVPKQPGHTCRQWHFFEKGQMFGIVSVLRDVDEKALLPDVKTMLNSFEATNDSEWP